MAGKGDNYKAVECSRSLKISCFMTGLGINDRFNDDMLLQILSFLPLKSAVACKSVCKRWLSLISTDSFVSCFISRRHHHDHHQQNDLVLKAHDRRYLLFLTSEQVPNPDISFSFLPGGQSSTESSKVIILAWSDDLFLCASGLEGLARYFLCNPFTKKWLELPPPPPSVHDHRFGVSYKPYYKVEGDKEHVIMNSSCRFRLVRLKVEKTYFLTPASAFKVDIFTSETWQWTTTMMHCPIKIIPTNPISHNGFLYWMSIYGEVVVHDPYNNNVCYAISLPQPEAAYTLAPVLRISVSEGSPLAFLFYVKESFRVWELEDWNQREWRLKSEVELNEYLVNYSEMLEWAGNSTLLYSLASHPNDKNVFFLWSPCAGVGTINLRTRVFKPRFLPAFSQLFVRTSSRHNPRPRFPSVLAMNKAPCWPTPISALLNQPPMEQTGSGDCSPNATIVPGVVPGDATAALVLDSGAVLGDATAAPNVDSVVVPDDATTPLGGVLSK